jgi:hypothetical protein
MTKPLGRSGLHAMSPLRRRLNGGRNTSSIMWGVWMSTRRVKKGPGRRPLSAKRQRFMELHAQGSSYHRGSGGGDLANDGLQLVARL